MPASGAYEWHVGQSTRPFVAAGQKEAYTLTCEQPDGTVLDRFSLVIDRGQTVVLNPGCGGGRLDVRRRRAGRRQRLGARPGSVATPSVNG